MVERLEPFSWKVDGIRLHRCFPNDSGRYVSYSDYAALEARVAEMEKDAARYRVARKVISLHDLYSAADSTEDYSREVDMLIDRLMGSEA